MGLGRNIIQPVLSVIALLWLAVWTACGSEAVVAEGITKVMSWTWCQTPLFPLEEQMVAPQCTRQGDTATRRSKQGVKTHTNTDTFMCSCIALYTDLRCTHTLVYPALSCWMQKLDLNSFIVLSRGSEFILTSVIILVPCLMETMFPAASSKHFVSSWWAQTTKWSNIFIERVSGQSAHTDPCNFLLIWPSNSYCTNNLNNV